MRKPSSINSRSKVSGLQGTSSRAISQSQKALWSAATPPNARGWSVQAESSHSTKGLRHSSGSAGGIRLGSDNFPETARVGTDKTDKTGSGGFGGSFAWLFSLRSGGIQSRQRLLASIFPPDSRIEAIRFAGPSGTLVTLRGFLPDPAVFLEHQQ